MPRLRTPQFATVLGLPAFCACLFLSAAMASAQIETIIHSFQQGNGVNPYSGLIAGPQGRLYGNAWQGGAQHNGVVFEMAPPTTSGGSWGYGVLYNFGNAPEGANPRGNMLRDKSGNLYGTTQDGGVYGCGTVYELSPPAQSNTKWTETILHAFDCTGGATDGASPTAGVIFDGAGNLWGTTNGGGTAGLGTVFELSPPTASNEPWTETLVYSFQGNPDGAQPYGTLLYDAGHNKFYGLTPYGGTDGHGTFYQILSDGTEKVIYSFLNKEDGGDPVGTPSLMAKAISMARLMAAARPEVERSSNFRRRLGIGDGRRKSFTISMAPTAPVVRGLFSSAEESSMDQHGAEAAPVTGWCSS